MDKIWVINHRYQDDDRYWDNEIDPDYGFFTSEEDAQAKCDVLNNDRTEYDKAVAHRTRKNEQTLADYELKARQNKVLEDSGMAPAHRFLPHEPRLLPIISFEEWQKNRVAYYQPYGIEKGTLP